MKPKTMKRASAEPAKRAAQKLVTPPQKPSERIRDIAKDRAYRGGFINPQISISDLVAWLDERFGK